MQTRNKILDDVSQLMTNAMGVAQGAKDEAENAVKGFWTAGWLSVISSHAKSSMPFAQWPKKHVKKTQPCRSVWRRWRQSPASSAQKDGGDPQAELSQLHDYSADLCTIRTWSPMAAIFLWARQVNRSTVRCSIG